MINPYAPPTSDDPVLVEPRDAIKARVSRPATALIIMSSIQSVFIAIDLLSAIFVLVRVGAASDVLIGLVMASIQLTGLILIAVGAAKLGFLESYRLARLGAWLACIPWITPFVIIGIPFGIWALRLLSDPAVRAWFPDLKAAPAQTGR